MTTLTNLTPTSCSEPSPAMIYQMCHEKEIMATATDLVDKLVARNDILEDVLDLLLTTAVTRREYTRSLAYVVKIMAHELTKRKSGLDATFSEHVNDIATATFIDYWQSVFECDTEYNTTEVSPIDPIAISAFIGDLTSLGLLPYDLFKVLMEFLMNRMRTRSHIDAIHAMLSHAAAHSTPKLPLTFLYDCRAIVKKRSKQCMWPVQPIEERLFSALVLHLIDRESHSKFPEYYDSSLNLEDALMGSVCVQPVLQC